MNLKVILTKQSKNYAHASFLTCNSYKTTRTHVSLKVSLDFPESEVDFSYKEVIVQDLINTIRNYEGASYLTEGYYINCFLVNYCIYNNIDLFGSLGTSSIIAQQVAAKQYFIK
jgi:hypothetical protein